MHPSNVLPNPEEPFGTMLLTLGLQSQLPFAVGQMSTGLFRRRFWTSANLRTICAQ